MKTSCICHPENNNFLVIRSWQLAFCDGNHCAAALLSVFEYWHNIKLRMQIKNLHSNDIAAQHGDDRTQDESLFQFHNIEDLQESIQYLYSTNTIQNAIDFLVQKGVVSIHSNPNPKYRFDKTRYFLFRPEILNCWLKTEQNLNYIPRKKTKTNSGSSTPCATSIQPNQEELKSSDENQAFAESLRNHYRSTSIKIDRSSIENCDTDLSKMTDRSINFDRRSIKIDKAITNDNLQREKAAASEMSEFTIESHAAASFLSQSHHNDSASIGALIANALTSEQKAKVEAVAKELNPVFPHYTLLKLTDEISNDLLNPKSFTQCGKDFSKKLGAIRAEARKGGWSASNLSIQKRTELKTQEEQQHIAIKAKIIEAQNQIISLRNALNDPHSESALNGFRYAIQQYEHDIELWLQELDINGGQPNET